MTASPETVTLPAGHTLAVTADAASSGNVYPFAEYVGDTAGLSAVAASATVTLGPFATIKRYQINPTSGSLSHVIAAVDFPTLAEGDTSAAALIATAKAEAIVDAAIDATTKADAAAVSGAATAAAAALLAHVPVVGTVGDVRDFIGAGSPAATAQATLAVAPAGANNDMTFTAVAYGAGGNSITVSYVDPAAINAALSVAVVGSAITVNLATDGTGAITSTAAQVKTAVDASGPAAALATVANTGADTGAGIVTAMAVANFTGGTGLASAIGVAGIGTRYTDITNGKLYINTGTKAVPVWGIVTSA